MDWWEQKRNWLPLLTDYSSFTWQLPRTTAPALLACAEYSSSGISSATNLCERTKPSSSGGGPFFFSGGFGRKNKQTNSYFISFFMLICQNVGNLKGFLLVCKY